MAKKPILILILLVGFIFIAACDKDDDPKNPNENGNNSTSKYGHPKRIVVKFEDGIRDMFGNIMTTEEEIAENLGLATRSILFDILFQSIDELTMTFVKDVDEDNAVYQMIVPTYQFMGGYNYNLNNDSWWGPIHWEREVRVTVDNFTVEGEFRIEKKTDGTLNIRPSANGTNHMKSTPSKIIKGSNIMFETGTSIPGGDLIKDTETTYDLSFTDMQITVYLIDGVSSFGYNGEQSYISLVKSNERERNGGNFVHTENYKEYAKEKLYKASNYGSPRNKCTVTYHW